MALWRRLARGFRTLAHPGAADREAADEVRHYLEQATADHLASGLSPEEASRTARLELGSQTAVTDEVRRHGWENLVETLYADLRYAARRLYAEPGFTVVTVLTLATGIGATTAIFSAVHPILLQPLPYPAAERIMTIWDFGTDGGRLEATFGTLRELQARSRSFESFAVSRPWQPTLRGRDEPERLEGQRVSADYFRVLGVPPSLGQNLLPSDDRLGGPRIVVLSHPLWRRRFRGERDIVGRTITLDGESYLVAGVMPAGFQNVPAPSAELWTLLQYDMSQDRAWGHHLYLLGRLRPGVTTAQGRGELDQIARRPVAEFPRVPWASLGSGLLVGSLQDDVTRGVRPALLAVFGAVILLLAIACANVTNLLLARGVRRRAEFALRAALGAGHGRLIRQLLTESLLLAAAGGLAGMAVAALGVRAIVALSPPGLPLVETIAVDGAAFAFGLGITTVVGLALGLLPALEAARSDPQDHLKGGSPRSAGGGWRASGGLVVIEVALAVVLLVGSGLLLRSLQRLLAVDVGFDAEGLLTMQVQAAGPRFDDDSTRLRFFSAALEAVRRVPGVAAAGLTSQLPLSGDFEIYGVHLDPESLNDPGESRGTFRYAVSPGYLEAMRISLRRGRLLDERDRAGAPRAALISESLARRRLPGADPIGQRLRIGPKDGPPYSVVGVVGDVRQGSLALSQPDAVYTTSDQWLFPERAMSLVVRARGNAVAALVPAIREAVWSVDQDQAIVRVATMDRLVAASEAQRRFTLTLFQAFALTALGLAAAGIYGVLAGSVAHRTRELGVRSALGASPAGILALVMRQGLGLTGIGIAAGVVGAAVATQVVEAMLFGVSRIDPITYVSVIFLLTLVAMLASGVPAWRAARVDPAGALRS